MEKIGELYATTPLLFKTQMNASVKYLMPTKLEDKHVLASLAKEKAYYISSGEVIRGPPKKMVYEDTENGSMVATGGGSPIGRMVK